MSALRWNLAAAFAAALFVAACSGSGGGGGNATCESDCVVPPDPICADGLLIEYRPGGTCDDGTCTFEVLGTTECEFGCEVGACIVEADPCDGIECDAPAPSCDGDVVVSFSGGTCADGECSFTRDELDCAAQGFVCQNGACVNPCDGIVCDDPPERSCDGDVLVTPSSDGTCDAGACAYDTTETDCGARGETCIDGTCAPIPCDTDCVDPAPGCEGQISVVATNGACVEGACAWDVTRTNCAARGESCVDGLCMPGPCDGITCDDSPGTRCAGTVLQEFDAFGTCTDGECAYDFTETDCADEGMDCISGRCVADPCADVVCDSPPPGRCEDGVAVSFESGVCLAGACVWSERRESCIGEGLLCEAGACVDPCADAEACDSPPEPRCGDESFLVTSLGPGVCGDDGRCEYTEFVTDCAALGETCIDGACRDACYEVSCTLPPDAFCAGDTAITYADVGACNPDSEACEYEITRTNCAADGDVCIDGACVTDPCESLTCDAPPAGRCVGNVAYIPYGDGLCIDGACDYAERVDDCSESGESCIEGACRGLCFGVLCDVPPRPSCEGTVAVTPLAEGTCNDETGLCRYDRETENCALDGLVCIDGECVEDPCEGVVCDTLPARTCDGDTLTSYSLPGICDRGACEYRSSDRSCADEGLVCREGACVSPCFGVTCDAIPAPRCEGEIRLTSTAGVCDDLTGDCTYPYEELDCADEGQICIAGACVDDPCDTITCDAPSARCDGDVRIYGVAPGACERGVCTYAEEIEDCGVVLGGNCVDGECVLGDPCEDIICDAPPPPDCVDERTPRTFAAEGTCADSTCSYEATLGACDEGFVCELGSCVLSTSCEGVVCADPPEPFCEGTIASTWLEAGECVAGACVYETVEVDCADDGLACELGECVIPCAGGCTTPPEPICLSGSDLLRTYVSPGTCTEEEFCEYGSTESDCADDGLVCIGDECVVDPCDIDVVCDAPPEPTCGDDVDAPLDSLIVYGTECLRGECSVVEEIVDCTLLPGYCDDGSCVEGGRCDDVVCPELPNDCFENRFAITYTMPECDSFTGECTYDESDVDCFADGRACFEGACVDGLYPDMVIITELMVFPDASGQWFEVYNVTLTDQPLDGVTFSIAGSDTSFTVDAADLTVASESWAVFASSEAVAAGIVADYEWGPEADFALPGDGAGTLLMSIGERELDRIEWDITWPFGPGIAAQLNNGNEDGDENADPTNWCAATTLYDATNMGTPGEANLDCPEDEDPFDPEDPEAP